MNVDINNIDIDEILRDYSDAKSKRSGWEAKWNLIHDNVFPRHDDYYGGSRATLGGPSDRQVKTKHGLMGPNTSTAVGMVHKIVSQLYALLVDPTSDWLGLEADETILLPIDPMPFGKIDAVSNWLSEIKKRLLKLLRDPRCDFYPSSYQHIFNLFTLGTACREITLTRQNYVKCSSVSMQSIYIGASGYGDVNRVYRKFELTNQEAFDIWGEGILQEFQYNPFDDKSKHVYVEFTGATPVELMEDGLPIAPYISIVIRESDRKIISHSLHKSFPYVVSRFDIMSGEIYGKTFLWDALPDVLTLNKLSKLALENIDYAVNPPFLVKDATSLAFKQLGPKAIVQGLDGQGRPSIAPMQGLGGDLKMLMEFYNIKVNELAEGLVANDPLTPEMPNMTATEVTQRKIQSANRIRPMLVRFEAEDLNPTIKTLMGLYSYIGQLPQFPYNEVAKYLLNSIPEDIIDKLLGKGAALMPTENLVSMLAELLTQLLPDPISSINIHFSGQMAKMQKMQEVQDINAIIQAGMQLAQVDSNALDLVDLGKMYRFMIETYGVTEGINDDETVARIRQERAERQSEQSAMQSSQIVLQQAQAAKLKAETRAIQEGM